MKPKRFIFFLAIFTTALLFGSSPVINKILLNNKIDSSVIILFRVGIASIVMFPMFIKERKGAKKIDIVTILILSLAAFNFWFFLIGLRKTTPNATPILYTATPLIVAIFASIFLKEKIQKKIFGIIIGLIGALIITIIPAIRKNEVIFGSTTGNIIVMAAVLCWSGFTAGSRYLSKAKGYPPIYLMTISFFISTALFAVIVLVKSPMLILAALTPKNLLLLSYLGIFVTVATHFLYQWTIKHSSANTASLMTYLQPPTVFLLAWIFLDAPLAWEYVLGTIIAFAGVFLAISGNRKKNTQKDLPVIE